MSTTVDERVVEMRFDNKHFESNVSTSMSTLDKLKQKLNLSGASKGLEDIDKASKKVNMSGLGGAVQTVSAKFSALQVMGVTALANITNSAVNAGKRIVSALTIDPIKTGFQEYETQINAVQTILANTSSKGTTIDEVNKALDELNKYADLTIYNFTEMTRNIGTFTAAGIDLDTSVNAIQGIANLAAVSGSTSQQASTAMYQLSQALATGTVKLMDWNSVVNAGMGGQVFQDALKETSKLLGTGAEAAIEASGSFRESLSDGWLTAEVLTETLKKFTSSGAVEYIAKYTGLSQETIDATLEATDVWGNEADAIDKAAEALAQKSGKNEKEIKDALAMAKNAQDAATKVKTFTQLWDVMKEAAQSGWSQTWKIIVGDFEEAKALITPLSDFFTGVINKMSDARNTLLESALGKGFASLAEKINDVLKPAIKAADTVKNVAGAVTDLGDIVDRVIIGEFGNGEDRFKALTEAGINYYKVQNKVNETLNNGFRYSDKQIEAQDKLLGAQEKTVETAKETGTATTELTDAQKDQIKTLAKLSDEQLRAKGYTEEQIDALEELRKTAEKLGIPLDDFIDNLDEINGRWLLINSFKNIGKGLIEVFKSIGKAWRDTFDSIKADDIFDVIAAFHKFTTKLIPTEDTAKKLTRTFKGLFAVLDIIKTILGGAFSVVFKVLSAVLGALDLNILDVTASIGDALVAFRDWLFETNPLVKAFNSLIDQIPKLIKKFREWFAVFKETPAVQKLVDAINAIGEAFGKLTSGKINIGEFAAMLGENLAKALTSLPGIAIQIGKDFIAGFVNGIGDSIGGVIKKVISFCTNFVSSFASALGVHSPSWKAEEIATDFFQGFINGAKNALSSVIGVLKKIGEGIIKVFKSLWDYLTDESGNIQWDKIFVGGSMVGLIYVAKKFADVFGGFASVLDGVGDLLENTGNAMKKFGKMLDAVSWDLKANALKKMAIAIAILVASIWVLTTIDDVGKLWNAVGVIAALAVILIGLSVAMDKLSSASVEWDNGPQIEGIKSGLLQIGIAILLVAAAVKLIGDLDSDKAEQGFKGLAAIALGMIAFLAAMGGISRYSGDVSNAGKMMKQMGIAMLLMVVACKIAGNLSATEMIKGVAFMSAFAGFVMAVTAVTKGAGKDINKVGGLVLKVSIAMMLMISVCKLAGKLSATEMIKGAAFAGGFVGFVAALVAVTKIANDQKIAKVNGLVFNVSVSMLLMVGVCKLAGMLSTEEMAKGAAFAGAFVLLVGALVGVLKIGNEQKIAKVTSTILAMSFGIAILAGVAILLSFVDLADLAKGVTAVSILSFMMTLMVKGLKDAEDVEKTMMYMALAIVAMAAAVVALSFIETKDLAASTAAMASLMGMFALMIRSMKGIDKVPTGPILTMIGVIVALAGVLYVLNALKVSSAISNAASLALLMIAMAAVLKLLDSTNIKTKEAVEAAIALALMAVPLLAFVDVLKRANGIKTSTKTVITLVALVSAMAGLVKLLDLMKIDVMDAIKGALALTLMAAPLLAFVFVLWTMRGVKSSIENVAALTILASACIAMLYPLSYLGKSEKAIWSALKGVIALTAMALPLLTFSIVLRQMNGIDNAVTNVKAMVVLMGALTLLLLPLIGAGALIYPALLGIAALTLMAVPMLVFVSILSRMDKVENATSNANLLVHMMTTITDLLVRITLVGPLAIIGVTAMTGLVALIGVVAVLATAIGALMDKFPSLQSFLDTGLPVLEQIAGSIGTMIGNFISGMAGGIADSMFKIGDELVSFTDNLSTASNKAAGINSSSFDGIEDLLLVLVEIAGTSVATSIGDLFSNLFSGESTMEKFISDAVTFFGGMKEISAASSDVNIDNDSFDSVIAAAQALADLQSSIEPIGGVISWFTGRSDLGSFGENVSQFIQSMRTAFTYLEGMTVDEAALDAVITASERLSTLQQSLESIGGVVDWFTGRDDLATFGGNVAEFFESMRLAMDTLEGMTVDEAALDAVITASERLSTLQQSLESIGGVVDWFTGRDDLATFGENVGDFMQSMKDAMATLEGTTVDSAALDSIISAAERLSTLQEKLGNIGGVVDWFTGRDDLGTFGESVAPFATGMQALSQCGYIDPTIIDSLVVAGGKLVTFQETLPAVGDFVAFFAGRSDLGEFGTGVGAFGTGMQALAQCTAIDFTILDNLTTAGGKMVEFQETLPAVGDFVAFFAGRSDLGQFGNSIGSFATGMQALSQCSAIDETALNSIITAADKLSELQKKLEPKGGILEWFTGRDDLGTFAETVKEFMENMNLAIISMNAIPEINTATFDTLESMTADLTALQKQLEPKGGIVDWFTGSDDLGTFGKTVKEFMDNMKLAIISMNATPPFDASDAGPLASIISACEKLSDLQKTLDTTGGVLDFFTGTDDLGTFGKTVKEFMENMNLAFTTMQGMVIPAAEVFTNITDRCEKLNTFQETLARKGGLFEKFTGEKDLGTFAKSVKDFAQSISTAFETISTIVLPQEGTFAAIKYRCELLNGLQEAIGSEGGVFDWFTGNDLSAFGKSINEFMTSLQTAFNTMTAMTFDPEKFTLIIDSCKQLVKLQELLDGSVGGVVSWWNGQSENLSTFGESIGVFADGMKKLSECPALDEATIQTLIDASTQLVTLQESLDGSVGGVVSWWNGQSENLGTFGTSIGLFADGMTKLSECKGFDEAQLESIITAAGELKSFQESLDGSVGGVVSWWNGKEEDLSSFGENVSAFATAMSDFGTAAASMNSESINFAMNTAVRLKNFITSLKDFDTTGLSTFTGIGTGGVGADGAVSDVAAAMVDFSNQASNISSENVSAIITQAQRLRDFISSLADLDISGIENFKIGSIGDQIKTYGEKISGMDAALVSSSISSANRLATFIGGLVELDASGVKNFQVGLIGTRIKAYSAAVSGFNFTDVNKSLTAANRLKTFVASLSDLNTGGVNAFTTAVRQLSTIEIDSFVSAFSGASGKMMAAGAEMFDGLIKGINSKLPEVKRISKVAAQTAVDAITDKLSAFETAGKKLADKLANGFTIKKKSISNSVSACVNSAKTTIREKYDSFKDAGKYLGSGLVEGINAKKTAVYNAAYALGKKAVQGEKDGQESESPSKATIRAGKWLGEGLVIGIERMGKSVYNAGEDMGRTAINATRSAMTTVLDALNSDMDAQPTIRPVIDLTDVRSGASAINGLLAGTQTVCVQSNLSAINVAMNRKLQNGTNDDIISAINDLNESLEGVGGDTYNFGGISYSNGDEIADAVQTIVRAALMGRRV